MIRLLLLSCLTYGLLLCSQTTSGATHTVLPTSKDSVPYMKKAADFIREVYGEDKPGSQFILVDRPAGKKDLHCGDEVIDDTLTFTKAERDYIRQQIDPGNRRWTTEYFKHTSIISEDTIKSIFADQSKRWKYFYQHFGQEFHYFSLPVFLRNDTYCLFYSDIYCGNLCGDGELVLYRKVNGKWVVVKSYCSWIS